MDIYRLRIYYEKTGLSVYISARNFANVLERTLRRISFPFKFTEGFHPRPKMSFGPPLPLFVAGRREAFDIWAAHAVDAPEILEKSNRLLPEGTAFVAGRRLTPNAPSPVTAAVSALYHISWPGENINPEAFTFGKIIEKGLHFMIIEVNLTQFSHKKLFEAVGGAPIQIDREIYWND